MITSSPLPIPESTPFHGQAKAIGAYETILQAEAQATRDEEDDNVVLARVVGFFLLEFYAQRHILGDRPFAKVIDDVAPSSRDRENVKDGDMTVFAVGRRYRDRLIRAFRPPPRSYPSRPPHTSPPSPPSCDTLEEVVKDCVESSGNDYWTARKKALARDGFRCAVTGAFDKTLIEHIPELQREQERLNASVVVIETSHIVNEPTTRGIGASERSAVMNMARHTTSVIPSLQQFGLEDIDMSLQAVGGVHQAWNLLSLQHDIHIAFHCLDLSFVATDEPNRYKLRVFKPYVETHIRKLSDLPGTSTPGAPLLVDLSSNYEGSPPPNPQLLAFHATCALIAHTSGVVKFLDRSGLDGGGSVSDCP